MTCFQSSDIDVLSHEFCEGNVDYDANMYVLHPDYEFCGGKMEGGLDIGYRNRGKIS